MINFKKRAQQLIELYAESLDVNLSWMLGWHQSRAGSQISRMMEFSGDIPPPSGLIQPDLAMISEIERARRTNGLLCQAEKMLSRLTPNQRTALVLKHRYVGTTGLDGEVITGAKLAESLGMTEGQFKQLLLRGRRSLERLLEREHLERQEGGQLRLAA